MPCTSTISANSRDIAFTDTGGGGAVVLLAHGFALGSTTFAGQAALARDQLALMDALGIGAAGHGHLFAALAADGPTPDPTSGPAGQIIGDDPTANDRVRVRGGRSAPLGDTTDRLVGRDDIDDRLAEITAPAPAVCGELDHSIPFERAERLRGRVGGRGPGATVPGSWHSPALTRPEFVNGSSRRS